MPHRHLLVVVVTGLMILFFCLASPPLLASLWTQAQQPPQAPASQQLPSVTLPPELARVLRDYEKAWIAKDARALAGLFALDGFVLRGGHPPVRGRAAIEEAYRGAGGPLALRALEYRAQGKVGWIVGAYAGSADQPDAGKFVLALVREEEGGDWQIAADMDNGNQAAPRSLPRDRVFDAIYDRFGNPDLITGSGRSFLHYDLANGQTVTLIVSERIVGSEVSGAAGSP